MRDLALARPLYATLALEGTVGERNQVKRQQMKEAMCALLGMETINVCRQEGSKKATE